uniref:Adenylate kinase n=1 Tax=Heligmosomoides polygyrus TaxID=6339 RepID=A0A8L8K765_HELPZ
LVSSPLTANNHTESEMGRTQRAPSVMKAAEVAQIPHIPVILFIGGPGGGKTRHAARIANALGEQGLVHICMPDIIRSALTKYKDLYPEWKTANEHYLRGELIPNHLALALVKAEMGRHPEATAFFLEGYPREARQVEDFEKQVKSVNMALILDYDEKTLRDHMEKRGMGMEIIDQRIKEFKQKTLPSAKYFDDQRLLHLIPGEKDDQTIYERLKDLVLKAMSTGVPIYNTNPSSQPQSRVTFAHSLLDLGSPVEAAVSNRSVPSSAQRATVIPDIQKPSTPVTTKCRAYVALSLQDYSKALIHALQVTAATQSRDGIPSRDRAPLGLPTAAPVILVIGAPGSQKVDIAKRIAQKYEGFEIISMGALLRSNAAAQSNDELWQRIARKIEQGEPVPMKLCRELLYNELRRIGQTGWGYVIEGYPRTEAQLTDLQTMVSLGKIDLAILIDCTEQFCLSTITKRGEQKDADRRMAVFKQNTLPMLKMLDEQGILRVVEGDSDPDTVFKDVSNIIDQNLFIRGKGSQQS